MDIQELISGIAKSNLKGQVTGISCDSRQVKPGYLFVCLSEAGIDFINHAIESGASFILCPNNIAVNCKVIAHSNPKEIYHQLAARFYRKHQPKFVAAVTGTNGKSSVVDFCRQLWSCLGYKSSSIGTLGTFIDDECVLSNSLTTPDSAFIHSTMADLLKNDVEYLCLEASSHGIDQKRLHSVILNTAAFTNFSQDHLDYHKNINEYFISKQKLFSEILPESGSAILNIDIPEYEKLFSIVRSRNQQLITYGRNQGDISLLFHNSVRDGHEIKIKIYDTVYESLFPVLGNFQLENLLCAIGIVVSSGVNYKKLLFDRIYSPRGRMEKVCDFVFVDYAHTPNALGSALLSLKNHVKQELIVVFGCGGNRDQEKRSMMGRIASKYAYKVVITDDNPRYEDAAKIRKDIMLHCKSAIEIADRREAIEFAIKFAVDNNCVVLIAGKGHEKTQTIGDKIIPFDDKLIAANALRLLYDINV